MKKYELFNDLRDPGGWIKRDLYECGYSLGLDRFLTQLLSNKDIENIENGEQKQFEVTMDYLSNLLREGKLKMKTLEYKEDLEKREQNSVTYNMVDSKEWEQSNIEEGIKYVKEKWTSIKNKEERNHFKDFGVMFTLPENEWMY